MFVLLSGVVTSEIDGAARAGRPVETGLLQGVEGRGDLDLGVALREVVDDRREALAVDRAVLERVVERQRVVEDRAAERRLERDALDDAVLASLDTLGQLEAGRGHRVRQAQLDRRAEQDLATVEGHAGLRGGRERATCTRATTVDGVGQ